MDSKKSIGLAVKTARKVKCLTQQQLAERTGLSRTYLCDVENGRYSPGIETVIKIADALGTSVDGILGTNQEDKEAVK